MTKIFGSLKLLETQTTVIEQQTAQAARGYRTCHGCCYDNGNSAIRDRKYNAILIRTADGSGDGLSYTVNIGTNGRYDYLLRS